MEINDWYLIKFPSMTILLDRCKCFHPKILSTIPYLQRNHWEMGEDEHDDIFFHPNDINSIRLFIIIA